MRISLTAKLLLSYLLILLLSMLPVGLYLRSHLRDRILAAVEYDEDLQARTVIGRLSGTPTPKLQAETVALTALVIDRITVFGMDGSVLADSSGGSQSDNQPARKEVLSALRNGYGKTLSRRDPAETLLYIARPLYGPDGRPRGVVRLARPVQDILSSFHQAMQFFLYAAAAAASLALLLNLASTVLLVRPLLRMRQAAQAYARGEYTHALPPLPKDEVGELGEALLALSRSLQREMAHHSEETAVRAELVRVLPIPLALLDAQLQPLAVNALLREALGIAPDNEAVRLVELCSLSAFCAAAQAARNELEPSTVTLDLPWTPVAVRLRVCPLPILGGELGWALVCEGSVKNG